MSGIKLSKINKKKLIPLLVALYTFLCNKPFFVWETYESGKFSNLFGIPLSSLVGLFLCGLLLDLYIFGKMKLIKRKAVYGGLILLSSILCIAIAGGIEHILSGEWLIFIVAALVVMLPNDLIRRSYFDYKTIFAVTLIIPIFYYIILHIGISIPYSIIQSPEAIKAENGMMFYKLYPLNLQLSSKYGDILTEFRLSGIYDEAGRLGTLAGLFLIVEKFKLRGNWQNIIIFIGGCLSLTLSFFMFCFVYFIFLLLNSKSYKKIIILIAGILFVFAFMNIKTSNPALSRLQSRLEITSTGLAGDNRTNPIYDMYFNTMFSKGIKEILFGQGAGALENLKGLTDGSSYKTLIFNYGFVGFSFQIVWLLYYAISNKLRIKNNRSLQYILLFIAYILNIYQRPTMFNMSYLLIFIGGVAVCDNTLQKISKENI